MRSYLNDAADFSKVRRVLVIKLQHLGDVLLTSPVFAVLKQRYPHLAIDALVFADTAPVLSDNPYIEHIYTLERISGGVLRKSLWRRLLQEYRLQRQLRARGYDLVVALTDRLRAAWMTRLLRPTYSVAQKFPQKRGAWWRRSFTHLYSIPEAPRHTVEIHLDALRRLGVYPQGAEKQLQIGISSEVKTKVANICAQQQLQPASYIVLHPASRWMFKSWSTHGFAEVLRTLAAHKLRVVLVSGPDRKECDYVRAILRQGDIRAVDLSGQLTLAELAQLIAQARCFVGLDSVAMHIAAAVGTPCVALFGPSSDTVWGPWMVRHRIVHSAHSCRPCNLDGCGNGKVSDCLQVLDPGAIVAAVLDLLCNDQS